MLPSSALFTADPLPLILYMQCNTSVGVLSLLSLSLYIYYNLNDSLTLFNMRLCVNNRLKPAFKYKLFVFVAKFSFLETQLEVKFSETNRIFLALRHAGNCQLVECHLAEK